MSSIVFLYAVMILVPVFQPKAQFTISTWAWAWAALYDGLRFLN